MAVNIPDRVYNQYRTDPNTAAWYDIVPSIAEENLFPAYTAIETSYNIDTNVGEQLNIIGRIVGQNRSVLQTITMTVIQFGNSTTDPNEFGDTETQFSPTFILNEGDVSDSYYRSLIKARIQKNNGDATIDDIIRAMNIVIPGNPVKVIDGFDMTFSLEFMTAPTPLQQDLLTYGDIVPRPQGVEFTGFTPT